MAGIGFRLQKYFARKGLVPTIKGIAYASIISSGPWLITIIAIGGISYFSHGRIGATEDMLLKAIITYSYAASLIMFGLVEMPVTRYLADRLFFNDTSTFRYLFLSIVLLGIVAGTIVGVAFYWHFSANYFFKMTVITLLAAILVIWTSMIFLSAAKRYGKVVFSFVSGGLLTLFAGLILGKYFFRDGYLVGFTLGQLLTAAMLSVNVIHEFKGPAVFDLSVLSTFKKYKSLIFIGVFYYAGIWVDKIVFWFSSAGTHVQENFYVNLYYDTSMFFAYLTILPSFTIFLIKVETSFYRDYHTYFSFIGKKANLYVLEDVVEDMYLTLRETFGWMLKVQMFATALVWYFTPEILELLRLPMANQHIFRYGVVGAFVQVLFLVMNVVMLYLEGYKKVLVVNLVFFAGNGIFSWLTVEYGGLEYWGLGYALACFLALISAYLFLNLHLKGVNFFIFTKQPQQERHYEEQVLA